MTTPARRSATAFLIARVNQPHIDLAADSGYSDMSHLNKLLQKTSAYLRGELKSEANLLRFHEAFCEWREQLPDADNLNEAIIQLISSAAYSAVESLFDPECDDTDLLINAVNEIYADMKDAGSDTADFEEYFTSLLDACAEVVNENAARPLPAAYFDLLKQADASLFGLSQ